MTGNAATAVYLHSVRRSCRFRLHSPRTFACTYTDHLFVRASSLPESVEYLSLQRRMYASGKIEARSLDDSITSNGTVALLDGNYVVIRLFHASKNERLQNREGKSTSAVFHFTKAIIQLRKTCSHVAVIFDTGGVEQLLRTKILPEYKGRRLEVPWMLKKHGNFDMPSELEEQLLHCKEACRALGIQTKEQVGYEADDIIATYVREARKDHTVRIISGDKDLAQLVGPNVQLQLNVEGAKDLLLDADGVEQRWGVAPERMGDLLSLAGDQADSVVGVPGIGAKKAAALLKRYNTLEAALEAAETDYVDVRGIGSVLCKSLRDNAPRVQLIRDKIIELENVPGLDPKEFQESFRLSELDNNLAFEFCRKYDFRSLIPEIQNDRFALQDIKSCPALARECVVNVRDGSACESAPCTTVAITQPNLELSMKQVLEVSSEREVEMALASLQRASEEQVFAIGVRDSHDRKRGKRRDIIGRELNIVIVCGESPDFWNGRRYLSLNFTKEKADVENRYSTEVFKRFSEEPRLTKVFHDFLQCHRSFQDFGLMQKHELQCVSHDGDTMHMARLWDPSLAYFDEGDYSIAFLRRHVLGTDALVKYDDPANDWRHRNTLAGCAATTTIFNLWNALRCKLKERPWVMPCQTKQHHFSERTMWDFYCNYWLDFGKLLVEMANVGVPVDPTSLQSLTDDAEKRRQSLEKEFRTWVRTRLEQVHGSSAVDGANVELMNVNSTTQLRQLLFGCPRSGPVEFSGGNSAVHSDDHDIDEETACSKEDDTTSTREELLRSTKAEVIEKCKRSSLSCKGNKANLIERILERHFDELIAKSMPELRAICKQRGLKVSGNKIRLVDRILNPCKDDFTKKTAPRLKVRLHGLGITPVKGYSTKNKVPSVSAEALNAMLDERHDELLEDGANAVKILLELVEVEAALSGFLHPLKKALGSDGRIHATMNINTETGRLSCRDPNLQNLPVGGTFPVRSVFVAPRGQRFIIADYAQLELRVVAQLANCKTMIEILNSGKDIHSCTAYEMFDHVKKAVDSKNVMLSGASCREGGATPLLKDQFPEERRQAKTLNFGVLYGMSPETLAKDWSKTPAEAKEFIRKWFDAFPAIRSWKSSLEQSNGTEGVQTLLGRHRPLRDLENSANRLRSRARRAAVNTPVQGGAADIATLAMLQLRQSLRLRRLKYRQILQIHDEVILEGPESNAEEALREVVRVMENPFEGQSLPFELKVALKVDARHASAWHETLQN